MAVILRYFTEIAKFWANYAKVVGVRFTLSAMKITKRI